MTTVQLCAKLLRPIMNRVIEDKKEEIIKMRSGIHNMELRKRNQEFKCEQCEFKTEKKYKLDSHMRLYHGHSWIQVKRSHTGKKKGKTPELEDIKEQSEYSNSFSEVMD